MITTLLWEDSRGGPQKGFAAHELLCSCLRDRRGLQAHERFRGLESQPRRGVDKVLDTLKDDYHLVSKKGPVIAVVDRDRVHEHLVRRHPGPTNCKAGIRAGIDAYCGGPREVVFLIDNMETLVEACCKAVGVAPPDGKPRPDERDRLIDKATRSGADTRSKILVACPSFARLVERVDAVLPH